jgi:hypothetical protein
MMGTEIRMTDYLEAVRHGKVYTSCFDSVLEVRKLNREALFVVPWRGKSWQKYVPERSRLLKIEDFDVRKELAPSSRLASSVKRKLLDTTEFEMTYALEMEHEKCRASILSLAEISLSGKTVVIFGKAPRGEFCHRYMLGKLISRSVSKASNSRHASKIKAYAGELTP